MGSQVKVRRMDEGRGDWARGLVCMVMVACMGEERGRQTEVMGC